MNDDRLLIDVEALTAGYARPVVGPVSLRLRGGEVLGLVGPNGCGKSTLLAALTGAARQFSGSIGKRPGVRLSLQQQKVPPVAGIPLNGRELLALTGATSSGLPDWLLPRLEQRLDQLSGGQLQFLSLWACLQAPAELVLLDEPTNNLDLDGVRFLAAAVKARRDAGAGLLIVSHDRAFIDVVCDRIEVLA